VWNNPQRRPEMAGLLLDTDKIVQEDLQPRDPCEKFDNLTVRGHFNEMFKLHTKDL
jgi:hypothetical protein